MATSGGDAGTDDSDFIKELLTKGIKEKSIEHLSKHDVDSKEALRAVNIDGKELNLSVGQKAILRKIKQEAEGKKTKATTKDVKTSHDVKTNQSLVATTPPSTDWQWRSDDGTTWTSYNSEISGLLEQLSRQGLQSIDLSSTHNLPYTVDMRAMTQTRNNSGTKRPIRRRTGGSRDQDIDAYGLTGYIQETEPATFPLWEWEDDSGKGWELYDNEVAEFLEEQHSRGSTIIDLNQSQFSLPYVINLQTMQQTRTNTGKVRQVRRTILTDHTVAVSLERHRHTAASVSHTAASVTHRGLEIPPTWDPMSNKNYITPDVNTGTAEYRRLEAQFLQSMRRQCNVTVYRITRIQNMALWEFYNVKKKQMIEELGESNINERELFHGTKRSVMESICKNNFDWRHSGTNGTAYGHGSYFATEASYSHQYTEGTSPNQSTMNLMMQRQGLVQSQPNMIQRLQTSQNIPRLSQFPQSKGTVHQKVHKLFIAKVLCGKYTTGSSNLRTPPAINPVNSMGQNIQPCGPNAAGVYPQYGMQTNRNYGNQQPMYYNQQQNYGQTFFDDDTDDFCESFQGSNAGPFYDSCVDNTSNPSVYVIFEKTQCYPAYIIEYGS